MSPRKGDVRNVETGKELAMMKGKYHTYITRSDNGEDGER